jgi:hypothetical protein
MVKQALDVRFVVFGWKHLAMRRLKPGSWRNLADC